MKWKPYKILNLQKDARPMVVATSYKNLLSFIPAIRRELEQMGYTGDVLFDQFLSVGHAKHRFLKSTLGSDGLLHRHIELAETPGSEILDELSAFYASHPSPVRVSRRAERHDMLA